MIDTLTRRWIQSAADERAAAAAGCYFDERAGTNVVEFFRRFLCHSKGSKWAGKPFELLEWQRDGIVMPLFGWKREDGTRRFRKSYIEIPKKNGKSTLASGIGLYCLVGDSEPGAEVYSAATDQEQAGIVHGEAIRMVEASGPLNSVLNINQSTKVISFKRTQSFYKALSKEVQNKEGLNAHAIIADELHAWKGNGLWNALKYAGRARSQSLLFVITTAGDDMQSVCYQEYEYAKGVLGGTVPDNRFFAYIREAGPKEDWLDPAVWHKANPSLGVTIRLDEFADDVKEAQQKPAIRAAFKRYSLNVWNNSTTPWLQPEDWAACREDFSEDDLAGEMCVAGLDLAKTRDLTALTLVFPDEDGRFKLLPYFWLPEDRVNAADAPAEYKVWADQGFIEVTPGAVCDYRFVERRIVELADKFEFQSFAFDPYNAEQVTQLIDEDHGIKRFEFKQTMPNYAGPTAEFERLVLSRAIQHNGHPVLAAQAGWVNIYTNSNGDQRPVKPKRGSGKTIDGIVAAIMGLSLAAKLEPSSPTLIFRE